MPTKKLYLQSEQVNMKSRRRKGLPRRDKRWGVFIKEREKEGGRERFLRVSWVFKCSLPSCLGRNLQKALPMSILWLRNGWAIFVLPSWRGYFPGHSRETRVNDKECTCKHGAVRYGSGRTASQGLPLDLTQEFSRLGWSQSPLLEYYNLLL